jgi:hypothetical protein
VARRIYPAYALCIYELHINSIHMCIFATTMNNFNWQVQYVTNCSQLLAL